MADTDRQDKTIPVLHEAEQRLIGGFIEKEFGIRMPLSKKGLLEGRLAKRVLACSMQSYREYYEFITRSPAGQNELIFFTDLVSTHETSFFREEKHFRVLSDVVVPELLSQTNRREITVLSAACSSGEEAYSIAMQIMENLETKQRTDIRLSIEGLDLSQRMIEMAIRGVYAQERCVRIPPVMRHNYVMNHKDHKQKVCRMVPEIRNLIMFHTGNLVTNLVLAQRYYDIIFCRNVLIYFDRPNQSQVVNNLLSYLHSGGYLFLGHSESMNGMNLTMHPITNAVYRKD